MLQSPERLRRASVFQRAYSGRKQVSAELFTLYVLPRTGPAKKWDRDSQKPWMPLVGFVVSKKTLKKANDRNRAKRRVREAYRLFRLHQRESTIVDVISSLSQWYALVWVLKETAVEASWQEICKRMDGCLLEADRKFGRQVGRQERSTP